MDNISIVMSYHDPNIINYDTMFELLNRTSHDIYLINTNFQTTKFLEDIKKEYPYEGVRFDEFTSQSYFNENITDKNEYIYHVHYRRLLDISSDSINLDKKTIYVSYDDRSNLFGLENICFKDKFDIPTLSKCVMIISNLLNISVENTYNLLVIPNTPVREMYLCHKSIFQDMMSKTNKFISMICEIFKEHLTTHRFVGFMIEIFMGMYLKKLEVFDGYNLKYIHTYIV